MDTKTGDDETTKTEEVRPRRKRKLTNYEEGHLHWIEETQIHKALMKSLRDQKYNSESEMFNSINSKAKSVLNNRSPSKMPRLSASVSNSSENNAHSNEKECNQSNLRNGKLGTRCTFANGEQKQRTLKKRNKVFLKDKYSYNKKEDSNACCVQHATMMQPRNLDSVSNSKMKDCLSTERSNGKPNLRQEKNGSSLSKSKLCSDEVVEPGNNSHTLRSMAQRKFASNAVPFYVSEKTRDKQSDEISKEVDHGNVKLKNIANQQNESTHPETKDFLTFLCFRNTSLQSKLINLKEFAEI